MRHHRPVKGDDKYLQFLLLATICYFLPSFTLWTLVVINMFRTWRTTTVAQPTIRHIRALADRLQLSQVSNYLFPVASASDSTGSSAA